MDIAKDVYAINEILPEKEKYALISQLWRASISIPSNIAEGSAKSSDKDYKRFLEIALGSSFEIETQLIIIDKIYLEMKSEVKELLIKVDEEEKMIIAFIKTLSS